MSPLNRLLLLVLLLTLNVRARADLGVIVADPTTISATRYTSPGHSAIFFSGICAASPVRARLCGQGEQGSVVTSYPNFREARPYSWNIVPLSLYLQGSLTPGARLLYGSPYVKQALELHARETVLHSVCQQGRDTACPQLPHSYWRDLVAATVDRDIFLYAVRTTPGQDRLTVAWLNQDANINHYNLFTYNCADFTSSLVNTIFPHSVHRDLLNDVGIMTPKAAARSFTLWALRDPELGFYSLHFAQVPGDVPRGGLARSGTETVIHSKKYVIPAIVLGDWELPTSIFASYLFTGRFSLYSEYAQHSTASESGTANQQQAVLGTPQEWAAFRQRFADIQNSADARNLAPVRKRLFPQTYATATATVDAAGLPWLTPDYGAPTVRVGLSSQNLLAPDSDPELAFQLMLGRIRYVLAVKNRMRESMQEFRQDWALLEQTESRLRALPWGTALQASRGGSTPPPPARDRYAVR